MSIRLFSLKDVPDDEAEEVRMLLSEHEISCYETHGGNWGVGTPAIWLHDDTDLDEAQALIALYQKQRYEEKRAEYEAMKAQGSHSTFLEKFKRHPVAVIAFLLVALFILYASLSPFLNFGE